MNALQTFLKNNPDLNEIEVMNRLTDARIISDNSVLADSVADPDCDVAVRFLDTIYV